jgi:hypothetical protein
MAFVMTRPTECGTATVVRARTQEDLEQELRDGLERDLKFALIRDRMVSYGYGSRPERAAEAVYNCAIGNERAEEAWARLLAAKANSASDAEILSAFNLWYQRAVDCALTELIGCCDDGKQVTFGYQS